MSAEKRDKQQRESGRPERPESPGEGTGYGGWSPYGPGNYGPYGQQPPWPAGMFGYGMPPGGHGGPQPQYGNPFGPMGPMGCAAFTPAMWWPAIWSMFGPWWAWLMSWWIWPGMGGIPPVFGPMFPPGQEGGFGDAAMRFADTRAQFWQHCFAAMAQVARQAANASYVGGRWSPPVAPFAETPELEKLVKNLPDAEAARVKHAMQMLQTMEAMWPRPPQRQSGEDW
jgi:hypothetical protein